MAWGINTKDFNAMAKGLREAKPELAKELKQGLKRAGEITAAEARVIAGEHSKSIPPTVKTSVRQARVEVRAGGPAVPLAGLYEYGNKGGKSAATTRSGKFRHPVFGDKGNWVEQDRHPFLMPAVERTERQVEAEMLKVLDAAARKMVE